MRLAVALFAPMRPRRTRSRRPARPFSSIISLLAASPSPVWARCGMIRGAIIARLPEAVNRNRRERPRALRPGCRSDHALVERDDAGAGRRDEYGTELHPINKVNAAPGK